MLIRKPVLALSDRTSVEGAGLVPSYQHYSLELSPAQRPCGLELRG